MLFDCLRFYAAQVALAAAPIDVRIAIEKRLPEATAGDADAVLGADDRREIADNQHWGGLRAAFAEEGEDASSGVGAVDPFEAARVAVVFVQGRLGAVEAVQVSHPALD